MKVFFVNLMMVSSLSYGADNQILSEKMSASLSEELSEFNPGKYQISLLGSYQYQQLNLPVFLSALQLYKLPEALGPCNESRDSLVCQTANAFNNWYDSYRPVGGGELKITAIVFKACEDGEFPCPLLKKTSVNISVSE